MKVTRITYIAAIVCLLGLLISIQLITYHGIIKDKVAPIVAGGILLFVNTLALISNPVGRRIRRKFRKCTKLKPKIYRVVETKGGSALTAGWYVITVDRSRWYAAVQYQPDIDNIYKLSKILYIYGHEYSTDSKDVCTPMSRKLKDPYGETEHLQKHYEVREVTKHVLIRINEKPKGINVWDAMQG